MELSCLGEQGAFPRHGNIFVVCYLLQQYFTFEAYADIVILAVLHVFVDVVCMHALQAAPTVYSMHKTSTRKVRKIHTMLPLQVLNTGRPSLSLLSGHFPPNLL